MKELKILDKICLFKKQKMNYSHLDLLNIENREFR